MPDPEDEKKAGDEQSTPSAKSPTESTDSSAPEKPPEIDAVPPHANVAPVALKRPRGRPRKHPLPERADAAEAVPGILGMIEVPGSGSDPSMTLTVRAAVSECGGTVAPVVIMAKRSRGRPRKNPLEVRVPSPVPGTGAQSNTAVKRPRGRPRKIPLQAQVPQPVPGTGAQADTAVKRPRGRPRNDAQPNAAAQAAAAPVPTAFIPAKRPRGRPRKNPLPGALGPSAIPQPGPGAAPGRIQAPGPAPNPPTTKKAAAAARKPRRGGRRRKPEPSILNPFCPDCGTYLRMFRPARGRWRKVCPRCEPDRLIVKRDYRDYIDKTGLPCKDRGKCRPERCINALECEEMHRIR